MEADLIEKKGDIFLQLFALSPAIAIFFVLSIIIIIALSVISVVIKFNPNLLNNWLEKRGIRARDSNCNKCVKEDLEILKEDIKLIKDHVKDYFNPEERKDRIARVDKMLQETAITAGLSLIYIQKLPFVDFCPEVLKHWRNGGNGNTIERAKERIMETQCNKEIWRSAVNKDHLENGDGSQHFKDCLKAIKDYIG